MVIWARVSSLDRFVGRDEELTWLFERRDEAAHALVSCALVGQAGMGKTRLLSEFANAAGTWGDHVITVQPDPWWCEKGYHALRDAIRQLAALPDDRGEPAQWPGASPEVRAGLNAIFERDYVDTEEVAQRAQRAAEAAEVDLEELRDEMRAAAESLEFERAAELRDRIAELEALSLGLS